MAAPGVRDIDADLKAYGYGAPRRALYALGYTKHQLQRAADGGTVERVGRNWVVHPLANPSIATALKAGGLLGGASALRSFGVWVGEQHGDVWVALDPDRTGTRSPGVRLVWQRYAPDGPHPWRVSIRDALVQYVRATRREFAVAALDSALNKRLVTEAEVRALRDRLPRRCWPWLELVDGRAQSGLESIVRVCCLDRGWQVELQVPIADGLADLRLDGWLYVETDGSTWHDGEPQAAKDRRRNTQIVQAGGRWHRLSYSDVMDRLDESITLLARMLSDGPPRGC